MLAALLFRDLTKEIWEWSQPLKDGKMENIEHDMERIMVGCKFVQFFEILNKGVTNWDLTPIQPSV